MMPLPESTPPYAWNEPDAGDLAEEVGPLKRDTLPCAPPEGLDPDVLPTIERAVADASRLTAAGGHAQARDSLRMAFMMSGAELGIERDVLASIGDMVDRRAEA
jgi:hypothetical protein